MPKRWSRSTRNSWDWTKAISRSRSRAPACPIRARTLAVCCSPSALRCHASQLAQLIVIIGLAGLGSGGGGGGTERTTPGVITQTTTTSTAAPVSIQISTHALVWVCLMNQSGHPVINGLDLIRDQTVGPYDGKAFDVAFGNGKGRPDGERPASERAADRRALRFSDHAGWRDQARALGTADLHLNRLQVAATCGHPT